MPTFHTPEPITAVGDRRRLPSRLIATERDDTVVEIRPRDPSRASDVHVAEQARIDFQNGTLVCRLQRFSFPRRGAVIVDIELPSHSRLKASAASAEIPADGEYADCKFAIGQRRPDGRVCDRKPQGGHRIWRVIVHAVKGSAVVDASGDAIDR